MDTDTDSGTGLWVFGYGSLCWKPGFDYERSATGFVRGWARRFWQGNTTHRGVQGKPGRVATLVEEKQGEVWGRAFLVVGDAALPYLEKREVCLGGYRSAIVDFYPRDAHGQDRFPALVYIAVPDNHLWLGEAPMDEMASQIAQSAGAAGHNVEYVLRLSAFIRRHAPGTDDHLFTLERKVLMAVRDRRMCLRSLMGVQVPVSDKATSNPQVQPAPSPRESTFEFTARVPPKKLRCVNI